MSKWLEAHITLDTLLYLQLMLKYVVDVRWIVGVIELVVVPMVMYLLIDVAFIMTHKPQVRPHNQKEVVYDQLNRVVPEGSWEQAELQGTYLLAYLYLEISDHAYFESDWQLEAIDDFIQLVRPDVDPRKVYISYKQS